MCSAMPEEKVVYTWKDHIRVVPVMFVYMLFAALSTPATQQLLYNKLCHNGYPQDWSAGRCSNETFQKSHQKIEDDVSTWYVYLRIAEGVGAVCISSYMGVYCDAVGTKIPIIISLIGKIAFAVMMTVVAYFDQLGPIWAVVAYGVAGITGSHVTLSMAVFCLISKTSSQSSRSSLLSIVEGVIPLAALISKFSSGYLITYVRLPWIFAIIAVGMAIDLILCVVIVIDYVELEKEAECEAHSSWGDRAGYTEHENRASPLVIADSASSINDDPPERQPHEEIRHRVPHKTSLEEGNRPGYGAILNQHEPLAAVSHNYDTGAVKPVRWWNLFKWIYWEDFYHLLVRRSRGGGWPLWIILTSYMTIYINAAGISEVLFLYVTKEIGYTAIYYSYINVATYGVGIVYVYFSAPVLGKRLGWSDCSIVIAAAAIQVGSNYCYGLASIRLEFIWVAVATHGFVYPAMALLKSIVSKLVEKEDEGKVFSLIFAMESLCSILAALLYNGLYAWSLDFYPSLCFFVGAVISALGLVLFAVFGVICQ